MVSHVVNSCITKQFIEIRVWAVIVFMVMHIITWLKDEILGIVSTNYIQRPIIKLAVMAIIEE